MSTENQNQDFEKLQRLLKLKQYESPPPRFFNDFSGKVTARIRAGDVGRFDSFEDVVAQTPWLQRIWRAIEGRPAISGLFAAGVSGLLLAGMFLTENRPGTSPILTGGNANNAENIVSKDPISPLGVPGPSSSTTPAVIPSSLFGTPMGIQTIPASGTPIRFSTNGMPY